MKPDASVRRWLDEARSDLRYALRSLRRIPGFTIVAVVTLASGIGINAAVFSITNAVLFRGFPHVDPDNRIVYINVRQNDATGGVSYADFEDWRAQARSFDGMAIVATGGLRLPVNDDAVAPETCDATQVSANAFRVLRQMPILGRDFSAADEAAGAEPVAILSYGFWTRRYGQDPAIVGRSLALNRVPTTVIGVMGPDFYFPHRRVDLWLPIVPTRGMLLGLTTNPDILQSRQRRVLWFAFARLAHGATLRDARAELTTIGQRLERAYPSSNQGVFPVATRFDSFFGSRAGVVYATMWGAVGFVLLIACANVASLLLGRAVERSRETSIRIALGAGRGRIVRQLLVESLVLSATGGTAGWWLANWGVRAYQALESPPGGYNRWEYALDHRVLVYLVAISIATTLLFGLLPALRMSTVDATAGLRDGGPCAAGGRRYRSVSALLVAGEAALAVVLLSGAGLLIRSFLNVYTADFGVRTKNVLTASVTFPPARYSHSQEMAFFDRLTPQLQALPGVESVALASALPTAYAPRVPYEVAGTPFDDRRRPTTLAVAIGPTYFRTLGATVIAGRAFTAPDETSRTSTAIVNRQFARTVWPGQDPLGKRLRLFRDSVPGAWLTVVGVASDIVQGGGERFEPIVYVPFRQTSADAGILITQTRVPPESLAAAVRHEIQTLDPDVVVGSGLGSIAGPRPLNDSVAFTYWNHAIGAALFAIFAGLALLLASTGLYAVVADSVGRRTREIGIRTAMGATPHDIVALVFWQAAPAVGAGLAIGLAGSLGLNRLLQSQLVHVSASDPIALTAAAAVLVAAAALGCWIPAHRATYVDPVVALRHE